MPKEAYVYKLILTYLEKNGPKTTKEIVEDTGVSYSSVAKVLPKLCRDKRVKRTSGSAHSYVYHFVTHEPANPKRLITPQTELVSKPVLPVDPEYLRGAILSWVNNGWAPKSSIAAQDLLIVLSQLHQLYWQALSRGLPVDQSDLDHLKNKLFAARDIAHNFAEFFDRLLVTTDLWDSRLSATFVLEGLEDPVSYTETARGVAEALKLTLSDRS